MRVRVYQEFAGSLRYALQFRHQGRLAKEYIRAERWDRKVASEALDLFQYVYGIDRRKVRFEHH